MLHAHFSSSSTKTHQANRLHCTRTEKKQPIKTATEQSTAYSQSNMHWPRRQNLHVDFINQLYIAVGNVIKTVNEN